MSAVSLGPSYICIQSTTQHILETFPKECNTKDGPESENSRDGREFCFYGYKPRSRTAILQPTQVEIKYFPMKGYDDAPKTPSGRAQQQGIMNC